MIRLTAASLCSLPICVFFAALLGVVWTLCLEQPDPNVIPHYELAVFMYALSTIIEMTAEPLYVTAQILLYVRLKVGAVICCFFS